MATACGCLSSHYHAEHEGIKINLPENILFILRRDMPVSGVTVAT